MNSAQIRGTALLGLVIVGTGNAKGDAVLARLLGIVLIFTGTSHFARTTRIATWTKIWVQWTRLAR